MKKVVKSFVLLILLFCVNYTHAQAATIPNPVGDIYVQDFAQVLNSEQKKELLEFGTYLDEHTQAQIAVLTVATLENESVEAYAVQALHQYQLGGADESNGVLILLALKERKIKIEVGDGLETILPDSKVGEIFDGYTLPYLAQDDIGAALTNTYKQLYNEIAAKHKLKKQAKTIGHTFDNETADGISMIAIIIFLLIIIGLIFLDYRYLGGAITLTLLRALGSIVKRPGRGPRAGRDKRS